MVKWYFVKWYSGCGTPKCSLIGIWRVPPAPAPPNKELDQNYHHRWGRRKKALNNGWVGVKSPKLLVKIHILLFVLQTSRNILKHVIPKWRAIFDELAKLLFWQVIKSCSQTFGSGLRAITWCFEALTVTDQKQKIGGIPHICHFFFTHTLTGLKSLHAKCIYFWQKLPQNKTA